METRRFSGRQVTVMVIAVCAAVVALPAGVFAATGGTFVLGHSNSAGHTTALKNTGSGAALSLAVAKASSPVLSVGSNKTRIPNLNADLLDGLTGSALQRRVAGTCAAGSAMQSVTSVGRVGCTGTTVGFSTPGTFSYVAPAGVTHVIVSLWGAGGGGAGSTQVCSSPAGGGQGAFLEVLVPVTPGTSIPVQVGQGGAGAPPPTANCDATGVTGGGSSFGGDVAKGGAGGTTCATGCGQGGDGGLATISVGAGLVQVPGAPGQDSGGGAVAGGGTPGFVGSGGASNVVLGNGSGDNGIDGLVLVQPAG